MTYKFLLSINLGTHTLISDERNKDKFIEIGLSKPSDWDDEDWLCEPAETEYETEIDEEEEEGEAAPTGTDGAANTLNDSTESLPPLLAYLRFQWGPNADYQGLFRCSLPTLAPQAFQVELHRLNPGLEDMRAHDISIYASSPHHDDEIILDDNGIPLLVVFFEWSGGRHTRYRAVTRAYAKRIVGDEAPVLSSQEIGRMLGPWKETPTTDVWKVDATIEEAW